MRLRARWLVVAGAVPIAAYAIFLVSRPSLERRIRLRLGREAAEAGLSLTVGELRLTPGLRLELRDVLLERAGRLQIAAHTLDLRPRVSFRGLLGRATTVSFGKLIVRVRPGVELDVAPSRWVLESRSDGQRLSRLAAGGQLQIVSAWSSGRRRVSLRAEGVQLSDLVDVLIFGCPAFDPGILDAEVQVEEGQGDTMAALFRVSLRGLALASLANLGEPRCPSGFGAPADIVLEVEAAVHPRAGRLRAERLRVRLGEAEASGRLAIANGWSDPTIELDLEVERLELARLLVTAGLEPPAEDLGSAALTVHLSGRLRDPANLVVTQRVDFTPPPRVPPSLERLRGPFVHSTEAFDGRPVAIEVSPDSPDFVALSEVPPLFLRALLTAEDAGFYSHPGIDLRELPSAIAKNLSRGGFVRGASTISQQVVKNLFLSKEKTIGRKLEEVSLALLLDATLGKSRLLEIYLNIVEWGPGLYGLRPAARHYFGVEPQALTPKQMVFLVSLLPGPVKYQHSFEDGVPTPYFDGLMATLLAKLAAASALSEAEYVAALAAPLGLQIASEPPETGSARLAETH
ncbi:MAG: transglycosylase domain-containing protein [Acidobacteria bacterium]|nr:transglycosylase domain-containing protein [Acidobacteriota bacterium]